MSCQLIAHLNNRDIVSLDHIHRTRFSRDYGSHWLKATDLGLGGSLKTEWDLYLAALRATGIQITLDSDSLNWSFNKNDGKVTASSTYSFISCSIGELDRSWHWMDLWRWQIPLRIKCFIWLCLNNKISTLKEISTQNGSFDSNSNSM